jgi:hypothetical protein
MDNIRDPIKVAFVRVCISSCAGALYCINYTEIIYWRLATEIKRKPVLSYRVVVVVFYVTFNY